MVARTEAIQPPSSTPLLAKLDLSKPLRLRLLVVDHPRLPQLTSPMLTEFLKMATANAREYLEVEVHVSPVGKMPLRELFRHYLPRKKRRKLGRSIIQQETPQAREAILWALGRSHRDAGHGDQLRAMIRGHNLYPQPSGPLSRHEIFSPAADHQLHVLRSLYAQTLPDGTPLVEDPLFGQAKAWEMLASQQDRAEMILTAHPIASAESGQTLPVALRGGVNAGLVAHNPGPFQGVIVFSTYPFLASDGVLTRQRGGPPADPVDVMALYLVHELGHLIRRWGHAWGHPAGCVMRPSLSLDYEGWFHRVRQHGPCSLPHPRMKAF